MTMTRPPQEFAQHTEAADAPAPAPAPIHVVFALFPRITQLDFTGPHEVLWRLPGAQCVLASSQGGRVSADGGLAFDTVPLHQVTHCDLLCVPGGYGVIDALGDTAMLRELARLGRGARHVTSVCTGSLLLGAAGLLKGHRAACHWAWRDLLAEYEGVTPDPARVVRDGHVITGGGVTAGIDLALAVVAEVCGEATARAVQLGIEYAPAPPFDAGRPETAGPAAVAAAQARLHHLRPDRLAAVRRAARALAAR